MNAPAYKHDCSQCTFLGTVKLPTEVPLRPVDLYFCPQCGIPTVIARFSDEPEDNSSGLAFASSNIYLGLAKELAIRRGLLERSVAFCTN